MPEFLETARAEAVTELAYMVRNDVVEARLLGSAIVVDPTGYTVAELGDGQAPIYPRSTVKPFQAIASLRLGAVLTGQQLALACGSHFGTEEHQAVAESILRRVELTEDDLGCPPDFPLSRADVARIAAQLAPVKMTPSKIAHQCSGKHAAMLVAAKTAGHSIADYVEISHPLQQEVLAVLRTYCETDIPAVGVDGCGAPAPVMPLKALARGFSKLAASATDRNAEVEAVSVANAMLDYPEMLENNARPDTVVTEQLGFHCKTGADGVLVIAAPDGTSVAVKMIGGSVRGAHIIALVLLAEHSTTTIDSDLLRHVLEDLVPKTTGGYDTVGGLKLAAPMLKLLS